MVSALDMDGAGLYALITVFLGKMHRHTDIELVEIHIDDGIAMKINIPPIAGFDAAVIEHGIQLPNPPVRCGGMLLYLTAPFLNALFELPAGREKGVAEGDMCILVGMILMLIATYRDFTAGQGDVDVDGIQAALMLMLVGSFYDNAAAGDFLSVTVQPIGELLNAGLQGR